MNKKKAKEDDINPGVDLADTFMTQYETDLLKVSGDLNL